MVHNTINHISGVNYNGYRTFKVFLHGLCQFTFSQLNILEFWCFALDWVCTNFISSGMVFCLAPSTGGLTVSTL